MDKNLIRKKHIELRKTLDKKEASKKIVSKILHANFFLQAKNVLIYYPLKYEIDLLGLLACKKNFFLPRVDGKNLVICPYSNNLKKSKFNIQEPVEPCILDPSIIDTIFVPSLAIDKNLQRVGYGLGYYDRFFSNPQIKAQKIGVIYKELLVDKIDACDFDKPLDFCITD